jgi:AraC family transcriptional regulator
MHMNATLRPPEARRSERIDELLLTEVTYPPRLAISPHRHILAGFSLTLAGSSTESLSGRPYERRTGRVLFRPAGERHSDVIGPAGARCLVMEIDRNWVDNIPNFGRLVQRPAMYETGPLTYLMHRVRREWQERDAASRLAIRAYSLEIACHVLRQVPPRRRIPVWAKRVEERLSEDLARTPTLEDLSVLAGVHPAHLVRVFRQSFGMSVGEYHRRRRVAVAADLMQRSEMQLTEIALALGFSHHAHFSRVFKRITGLTPCQFRGTRYRHATRENNERGSR